jgi:hypothetical protein
MPDISPDSEVKRPGLLRAMTTMPFCAASTATRDVIRLRGMLVDNFFCEMMVAKG